MENNNLKDYLLKAFTDYIKAKADPIIERGVAKISHVIGLIFSLAYVSVSIVLFVIFLGIGLSVWLSELTGKNYLGFLMMAGIYLLSAWIFWILRNRIISDPFKKVILRELKKKEEEITIKF